MKTWIRIAALALAQLPALAAQAAPNLSYLQNALDGRGRCLGANGGAVAMAACDKAPSQQWTVAQGDLPGYVKLQTAGDRQLCLAVQPNNRRNEVAMAPCSHDDSQQWYIERLNEVPRQMRLTNRAIGQTRCLESLQTGLKLTPCSRRQAGHLWLSDYLPNM